MHKVQMTYARPGAIQKMAQGLIPAPQMQPLTPDQISGLLRASKENARDRKAAGKLKTRRLKKDFYRNQNKIIKEIEGRQNAAKIDSELQNDPYFSALPEDQKFLAVENQQMPAWDQRTYKSLLGKTPKGREYLRKQDKQLQADEKATKGLSWEEKWNYLRTGKPMNPVPQPEPSQPGLLDWLSSNLAPTQDRVIGAAGIGGLTALLASLYRDSNRGKKNSWYTNPLLWGLLGATGGYLGGDSIMEWLRNRK